MNEHLNNEEDEDRIVVRIELFKTGDGSWYNEVSWEDSPASMGSGSYDTAEEALADALATAERRAI